MFYIDNIDMLKQSVVTSKMLFELGKITVNDYRLKLYQACELFDITYWSSDLEDNYKHLMARIGIQEKANQIYDAMGSFNFIMPDNKKMNNILFLAIRDDFLAFVVHQYYKYLMKCRKATIKDYLLAVFESVPAKTFIKSVTKGDGTIDKLKVLDYFKLVK